MRIALLSGINIKLISFFCVINGWPEILNLKISDSYRLLKYRIVNISSRSVMTHHCSS